MKRLTIIIAFLCATTPANAVDYNFSLTGTITSQTHPGYPEMIDNINFFPPVYDIQIGDTVTFKGRISSNYIVDFGDGYQVAYFYAAPDSATFDLNLLGYSWIPKHERYDGETWLTGIDDFSQTLPHMAAPSLLFKDGKVVGFAGELVPVSSPIPILNLGSSYMTGSYDADTGWKTTPVGSISLSANFQVLADPGLYENAYVGPSFGGVWNFAQSEVGIPEPATWALMIAGFGLVGGAMRRRENHADTNTSSKGA